jgi:hypothetical protein
LLETKTIEAEYPGLGAHPKQTPPVLKDVPDSEVVQTIVLVVALKRIPLRPRADSGRHKADCQAHQRD